MVLAKKGYSVRMDVIDEQALPPVLQVEGDHFLAIVLVGQSS